MGYEEGEKWVTDKMKCGYPRFMVHPLIEHLAHSILLQHGSTDQEKAMLFPTSACAQRCVDFLLRQNPGTECATQDVKGEAESALVARRVRNEAR